MLQLDITHDDTAILRTILESDLSDLGYEIANTDLKDFRDQLKLKQNLLQRVLGQLGDG